ncbi:MAG: hypothetical protein O3B37_05360 [Proteobacteria bacterium]|nr:hypothetical protein [Pseudomonadota bacterium]
MRKVLGLALAAALMASSGPAIALDKVQGVFTGLDVPMARFNVVIKGDPNQTLKFEVGDSDELRSFLGDVQDGDEVSVTFDSAQCAGQNDCTSTAVKLERPRS